MRLSGTLVECWTSKPEASSSTPAWGSIFHAIVEPQFPFFIFVSGTSLFIITRGVYLRGVLAFLWSIFMLQYAHMVQYVLEQASQFLFTRFKYLRRMTFAFLVQQPGQHTRNYLP